MQSHYLTDAAATRSNMITIDRPDSSQVEKTSVADDLRRCSGVSLARRFTRLHHSETRLERSTESGRKRGDGTGRFHRLRSGSTQSEYPRSSSAHSENLRTRRTISQRFHLSAERRPMFNKSQTPTGNRSASEELPSAFSS